MLNLWRFFQIFLYIPNIFRNFANNIKNNNIYTTMITIKGILDFLKSHGENNSIHTYFLPKGISMLYNGKKYDILNMGIFEYIGGTETPQFWGIELDEDGEDTTNGMYFSWVELSKENQDKIEKLIWEIAKRERETIDDDL